MKNVNEIKEILAYSCCSEAYHKFSPIKGFPVATDGVFTIAKAAGCFWLLDIIGSYQVCDNALDPEFQVWKLEVDLINSTGVVKGYNDKELIITQEIQYTDFPLPEIVFYMIEGVILLPSEY